MKFLSLFLVYLITFSAFAGKWESNVLSISDPDPAKASDDRVIKLGPSRTIRSNETTNVLEFSNDGVLFKKLGSGSGGGGGGGVPINLNGSFEDGVTTNWTAVGVVPTQEQFTNATEGDANYARVDFSAAAQTYKSDLYNQPDKLGAGCEIGFFYLGGDANIDIKILNGSSEAIYSKTLAASFGSGWNEFVDYFQCGTQMQVSFESTADAAQIDIDSIYLGENRGVTQYFNTAWQDVTMTTSLTGGSIVVQAKRRFTMDGDAEYSVYLDTSSGIFTGGTAVFNLPSGDVINTSEYANAPLAGKTRLDEAILNDVSGGASSPYQAGVFYNSATSVVLIEQTTIDGSTELNHSAIVDASNPFTWATSDSMEFTFKVAITTSPARITAISPSTTRFEYLGKQTIGASTQGNPVYELSDGVLENIKGIARLTCAGSNPSTGTTCSVGNEQVGLEIDLDKTGRYEVCADIPYLAGSGYVRMNKYTNSSESILVTGDRVKWLISTDRTIEVCSLFDINSAGSHSFKPTMVVGANYAIAADRAVSTNNRDITWRVTRVSENVPTQILVGGQLRSGDVTETQTKVYRAQFGGATDVLNCTASPCTVHLEKGGDWISTVTRVAAGQYIPTSNPVFKPNELVQCFFSSWQVSGASLNTVASTFNNSSLATNAFKANGSGVLTIDRIYTVGADTIVNILCFSEE